MTSCAAVEFSEFVIGFDLGDINMLSGTPAMLEELVPGLRYRFQVPDARDGTTDACVGLEVLVTR